MRSWRKFLAMAVFTVLVMAFFAVLAYGLANRSPVTGRSGVTRIGKPAPEFTMDLLGGGETRLVDYQGSPLVINFWASWCPPCRQESPAFERQWRRYQDQGIRFVGVNIQDSVGDAEAYIREFGLTFPNGRDQDGTITIDYGVIGLPVTFFVSSQGNVEGRWVGAVPEDRLEAWTRALIADSIPGGESEGETEGAFRQLK